MEAYKIIQSTGNGMLQIAVPEHFNNTPLEVIIIPLVDIKTTKPDALLMKKFFGTAKFPDTILNKDDAYYQ